MLVGKDARGTIPVLRRPGEGEAMAEQAAERELSGAGKGGASNAGADNTSAGEHADSNSKTHITRGALGVLAGDVRVAAQSSCDALLPVSEADWSRPAAGLDWTCRATLEHMTMALDKYSRWLATPTGEPTPPDQLRDPNLSIAQLLALLRLRAGVLAVVVGASDPTARGFPIWGAPDAAGYVAIACAEIFLHTDDIAQGLSVGYAPPHEVCGRTVRRLFPWAPTDVEPWDALRWATGRQELPGFGRLGTDWAWQGAPLSEWDGTRKTRASYPAYPPPPATQTAAQTKTAAQAMRRPSTTATESRRRLLLSNGRKSKPSSMCSSSRRSIPAASSSNTAAAGRRRS